MTFPAYCRNIWATHVLLQKCIDTDAGTLNWHLFKMSFEAGFSLLKSLILMTVTVSNRTNKKRRFSLVL